MCKTLFSYGLWTVPELEEAFQKPAEDFLTKYGFTKPAPEATNVVVACRSGRRAVTAIQILEKLGYNSLMFVHFFVKINLTMN